MHFKTSTDVYFERVVGTVALLNISHRCPISVALLYYDEHHINFSSLATLGNNLLLCH